MKLTFLGAAGEVTGSQHLVETDRFRVLLDCGLFQGPRAECYAKNRSFHCRPSSLDAVMLSHGHIDHCGNLPGLFRAGFRGPTFCTPATADVAALMLRDSLHIQEEDALELSRLANPGSPRVEPLYSEADVRGAIKQLEPLNPQDWHELSGDLKVRFTEAGHILGSAVISMDFEESGDIRRLVFTGDVGRRGLPLIRDPQPIEGCDLLITECTYANVIHPEVEELRERLLNIIQRAEAQGGKVIIPAFSLGRTQQLLCLLKEMSLAGRLPRVPIFVDSPLAHRMTEIYERHVELLDAAAVRMLRQGSGLFDFPMLMPIETREESKALNHRDGPFVVLSASGMCENGRVRHHLLHAVEDEKNTIALIGFQAAGTLGRRIAERQPTVRILDRMVPVRARVETLGGLSAHADAEDFRRFFSHMSADSHIGRAFLVHGEPPALGAMKVLLHDLCDEDPVIPRFRQSFDV